MAALRSQVLWRMRASGKARSSVRPPSWAARPRVAVLRSSASRALLRSTLGAWRRGGGRVANDSSAAGSRGRSSDLARRSVWCESNDVCGARRGTWDGGWLSEVWRQLRASAEGGADESAAGRISRMIGPRTARVISPMPNHRASAVACRAKVFQINAQNEKKRSAAHAHCNRSPPLDPRT